MFTFFSHRSSSNGAATYAPPRNPQPARPGPATALKFQQPRVPKAITLGPSKVGLIVAAGTAKVLSQLTSPSDPALLMAVGCVDQHVSNGTNYTAAIRLANDMFEPVPDSIGKHVYFVTDGEPNVEVEGLATQIERARRINVRIYSVPIGSSQAGHSFNLQRLYDMSNATRGKVKPISHLKALSEKLVGFAANGGRNMSRSVYKILIVDVSPSMSAEQWDQTTKLGAAKFAALRFLSVEAKRQ
jgi:hypothetical protein